MTVVVVLTRCPLHQGTLGPSAECRTAHAGEESAKQYVYTEVKVHLVLRECKDYRELVGGHWGPGGCPNLLTGVLVEEDPLVKVPLRQHVQLILTGQ